MGQLGASTNPLTSRQSVFLELFTHELLLSSQSPGAFSIFILLQIKWFWLAQGHKVIERVKRNPKAAFLYLFLSPSPSPHHSPLPSELTPGSHNFCWVMANTCGIPSQWPSCENATTHNQVRVGIRNLTSQNCNILRILYFSTFQWGLTCTWGPQCEHCQPFPFTCSAQTQRIY